MTRYAAWRAALAFAAACAALGGGCGDEEPCEKTVALPCNIREAACRCSVFEETKRVRNQPEGRLPPARVITREQYAAEVRAGSGGRAPSEDAQVYQAALKLLALLPTETSLDDAENQAQIDGVAAYYEPDEDKVTIIDDAAEKPEDGVFTLSHEYVHALQDQRERISELFDKADSSDDALSVKTLVEGEAVLLSDLLLLEINDRTFDATSLTVFDRLLDLTLTAIGKSPAPLTEAQLSLAYPVGASVLGKAYLAGGVRGVAGFYSARPRSVTGWLDEGRSPTLPARLSCGTPDAPSGFKAWVPDRMGGTAMIALGASLGFNNEEMSALAAGWSNDLFALYSVTGASAVALAWRIGFADATSATLLETRMRTARPALEITRSANELLIVGATDPSALAAWSAKSVCTTPKSRDVVTAPLHPDFIRLLQRSARRALHATAVHH